MARRGSRMGRLDPFCWLALGPLLLIATVVYASGVVWLGAVVVVLAVLLGVFDSWVNRPEPKNQPYRRDQVRVAPPHPVPQARPVQQARPATYGRVDPAYRQPPRRPPQR